MKKYAEKWFCMFYPRLLLYVANENIERRNDIKTQQNGKLEEFFDKYNMKKALSPHKFFHKLIIVEQMQVVVPYRLKETKWNKLYLPGWRQEFFVSFHPLKAAFMFAKSVRLNGVTTIACDAGSNSGGLLGALQRDMKTEKFCPFEHGP